RSHEEGAREEAARVAAGLRSAAWSRRARARDRRQEVELLGCPLDAPRGDLRCALGARFEPRSAVPPGEGLAVPVRVAEVRCARGCLRARAALATVANAGSRLTPAHGGEIVRS